MEGSAKSNLLWLVQAIKFSAVGLLNTAVDLGLYFVLTRWMGMGNLLVLGEVEGRVVAKGISYAAGILNSFFLEQDLDVPIEGQHLEDILSLPPG